MTTQTALNRNVDHNLQLFPGIWALQRGTNSMSIWFLVDTYKKQADDFPLEEETEASGK